MLFNSTEGACDFGDYCKYDSGLSGNGKRVKPCGSHLNPNPRTNKQTNKDAPKFEKKNHTSASKKPYNLNDILIYCQQEKIVASFFHTYKVHHPI